MVRLAKMFLIRLRTDKEAFKPREKMSGRAGFRPQASVLEMDRDHQLVVSYTDVDSDTGFLFDESGFPIES